MTNNLIYRLIGDEDNQPLNALTSALYDSISRYKGVRKNYGTRIDGTSKGSGWLGELPTTRGKVMTELTTTFSTPMGDVNMPLIVPTLSEEEINLLATGNRANKEIINKAYRHGMGRIMSGLSPYAD